MARKIEPGFYWLYFIHDKEWSVGEFDGNAWAFLGNDETFRELPDDVCLGVSIKKPPYHITTELTVKSDI